MIKSEVITKIAEKTGIEKTDVREVVENFFEVVKGSMKEGENVYFRGFGSFVIKQRAEKVARNIAKKESITIPAHNIPSFRPSKYFVNEIKESVPVEKK